MLDNSKTNFCTYYLLARLFRLSRKVGHEMRENYEKSDHLIMAKVSKQGSYFVKSLLRFVFTTLRNWIIS